MRPAAKKRQNNTLNDVYLCFPILYNFYLFLSRRLFNIFKSVLQMITGVVESYIKNICGITGVVVQRCLRSPGEKWVAWKTETPNISGSVPLILLNLSPCIWENNMLSNKHDSDDLHGIGQRQSKGDDPQICWKHLKRGCKVRLKIVFSLCKKFLFSLFRTNITRIQFVSKFITCTIFEMNVLVAR